MKAWEVKTVSGASGGVSDIAEVNLHITAPGYTVDRVAVLAKAAPELLVALEGALPILERRYAVAAMSLPAHAEDTPGKLDGLAVELEQARAAITKARGE